MRDINFFSPYIYVKKKSKKKYVYIGLVVALFIGLIGGFTTINILKEKQLEKEVIAIQAEVANEETAKKLQAIEEKKRKIELLTKHYDMVTKINKEIDQIDLIQSNLLKTIGNTLPKETFIKSMVINTGSIQFQGGAKGRIPIAELEHNLKQTNLFHDVHVNMINEEINEEESYSLNNQFNIECIFYKDVNTHEAD
jgi:Tfp pilus assembly protein PilN